jgi:hypothetical protein
MDRRRQDDCRRLERILDRHRLLGKKLGEYEIWRAAVEAWTGTRADRKRVLAECARRLRAYRSADNVAAPSRVHISTERLLAFFAGFATAEAHFGATAEGHPVLTINLRRDDGDLLRLFHDRLELGRLVPVPARGTSRAALSWRVARLTDVRVLVRHLDRYPPRGRVLRIYEAWRELVLLEDRRSARRRELAATVRERRAYKPNLGNIVAVDRLEERRARYLVVLKSWASATDPPRTVTSYEGWRRRVGRDAPKRETIAAAFGSWIAGAAGSRAQCGGLPIFRHERALSGQGRRRAPRPRGQTEGSDIGDRSRLCRGAGSSTKGDGILRLAQPVRPQGPLPRDGLSCFPRRLAISSRSARGAGTAGPRRSGGP